MSRRTWSAREVALALRVQTVLRAPPPWLRLAVAVAIGTACAVRGYVWRAGVSGLLHIGDVQWAFTTADAVLHGRDPYAVMPDAMAVPYPLPVALVGFALRWWDPPLAA